MRTNSASITINAPPELVWRIIADTDNYPSFDPTCVRIMGKLPDEGVRLRVYSTLAPDKAFFMKVTTFAPPRRMVWTGGGSCGLLKGVRSFAVDPEGRGQSRFTLTETFSGPLLKVVGGAIPDMQEAFEGFCSGLRDLAEAVRPPSSSAGSASGSRAAPRSGSH